jgi:hypothetical protein
VPTPPQTRFSVAAGVQEVLAKERLRRGARPEPRDGARGKHEPTAGPPQREVEHQVFAVVQPLRVAADVLPRGAPEQDRSARRQEGVGLDVLQRRQRGGAQRTLKDRPRVGVKEAAHHVHFGRQAGVELFEPVRCEAHTRVRGRDEITRSRFDRQVASARNVRAGRRDHA